MIHLPSKARNALQQQGSGWLLWGLLFCLFLGMGAFGWWRTLEDNDSFSGWEAVLERTFNLATGTNPIVVGEVYEKHWSLVFAQWGIRLVLAVAVIKSLLLLLRRQIRLLRFRHVSNHHVFAGLGKHSPGLVGLSLAGGNQVAVVCEDGDHPVRESLEAAGGLYVRGSPLDPAKLRAAGGTRADRVVVETAGGNDQTVAVAKAVLAMDRNARRAGGKGLVLLCIDCDGTSDFLNANWKAMAGTSQWQARAVDFEGVAVRQIANKVAIDLAAEPWILKRGPRILLATTPGFGLNFLRAAIPSIQLSGTELPEYFIPTNGGFDEHAFRHSYPAAGLVARTSFFPMPCGSPALSPELEGLHFDAAVVQANGELSALRLAYGVLNSSRFHCARVWAVVPQASSAWTFRDPALRVVSIFETGLESSEFGDPALEDQARANHETYLAKIAPSERAQQSGWDDLPEALKESNRRAILHREVKIAVRTHHASSNREMLIEHLSVCEHHRWMGEKIMAGWRGGKTRDNRRLIHPDIRPYAELSEEAKEKDRVQVRRALKEPPAARTSG